MADEVNDLDDTVRVVPRTERMAEPGSVDEDTTVREKQAPAEFSSPRIPQLVEPRSTAVADQSADSVPRLVPPPAPPQRTLPAIYSFRINNHSPIPLDVPAYIGRKPASPRVPGREQPRLVRVPSELREVSGTHLEVRQNGASVLVTDLKSTNGTVVRIPGSSPLKLRQGESVVVTPGTLVDIGDGNVLEILPIRRLAAYAGAPGERFS